MSRAKRSALIERENPTLPISQQCRLLAVSRSSVYRRPAITAMAVRNGDIALGERFGWIHVFEAGDLLKEAGNGS
jgi:hypothetical protein